MLPWRLPSRRYFGCTVSYRATGTGVSIAHSDFWRGNRCVLYQVSLSPLQLQGELAYFEGS